MNQTEPHTQPSLPIRFAMWSGPRNISTAMMRSWGSRPDTAVVDEPLYAHYLKSTGQEHPGADEVIANHESDWRKVVDQLLGPIPGSKRIYFQKHMAHHMLPTIDRVWFDGLAHAFLIRDPAEMLPSLAKTLPRIRLEDTGLPQQVELFYHVRNSTGRTPPVLDARDVLTDPRRSLTQLCDAVGVEFNDAMLSWPPGRRETDGIWAKHWYASVEKSTGFEAYRPKQETLPEDLMPLYDRCRPYYDFLHSVRLRDWS